MADVDVEAVAQELFWAAFRNTGQICIATKRMYVQKDVYEPLKDARVTYAKDKGYRFLMGGEVSSAPGYFVPITILDNPPEDARIVQDEQFGPVLPLLKFDDYEDAVARANAKDYGLGGSVWGQDEDKALDIAQRVASGTVWVNET